MIKSYQHKVFFKVLACNPQSWPVTIAFELQPILACQLDCHFLFQIIHWQLPYLKQCKVLNMAPNFKIPRLSMLLNDLDFSLSSSFSFYFFLSFFLFPPFLSQSLILPFFFFHFLFFETSFHDFIQTDSQELSSDYPLTPASWGSEDQAFNHNFSILFLTTSFQTYLFKALTFLNC